MFLSSHHHIMDGSGCALAARRIGRAWACLRTRCLLPIASARRVYARLNSIARDDATAFVAFWRRKPMPVAALGFCWTHACLAYLIRESWVVRQSERHCAGLTRRRRQSTSCSSDVTAPVYSPFIRQTRNMKAEVSDHLHHERKTSALRHREEPERQNNSAYNTVPQRKGHDTLNTCCRKLTRLMAC